MMGDPLNDWNTKVSAPPESAMAEWPSIQLFVKADTIVAVMILSAEVPTTPTNWPSSCVSVTGTHSLVLLGPAKTQLEQLLTHGVVVLVTVVVDAVVVVEPGTVVEGEVVAVPLQPSHQMVPLGRHL